jgi:abortive infection bacteriophage resistance protein
MPPLADPRTYQNIISKGHKPRLYVLVPYDKKPTSYQDQITLLKSRGLTIENEPKLLHLLEKINYYRFSGYCHPFLIEPKEHHRYKEDATFEKVYTIYKFDRELRQLVVRELEKIEVAVRAQISQVLSTGHNNAFWYTQRDKFKQGCDFQKMISDLNTTFLKSDTQFIDAYKKKYQGMPPCWMMFELISFGSLSMIYQNLENTIHKNKVAEYFGLEKKAFTSWLHCLTYVRNVCAHHSRLWNRTIRIKGNKPKKTSNQWLNNTEVSIERSYYVFSMMLYLLQSIDSKNKFVYRLKVLLKKYSSIDVAAMGFPIEWEKEPLWKLIPTLSDNAPIVE